MNKQIREICLTAILAILLTILGSFKLPSIIIGTEFQLSAPFAIAICVTFGFRRYFTIGIISSLLTLFLGTHTIINIGIALCFRIVVGVILHVTKAHKISILLAGPIGSTVSRIAMSFLLGKAMIPLLISAVPGMIFTILMSYPLTKLIKKINYYYMNRSLIYDS